MTRQGWAERKVKQATTGYSWNARIRKSTVILPSIAAKLLLAEHRRAVRILARLEKERQLNQFDMAQWEKIGYLKAIADIRTALQKGRT